MRFYPLERGRTGSFGSGKKYCQIPTEAYSEAYSEADKEADEEAYKEAEK